MLISATSRSARSATPAAAPMPRIVVKTLASEPRFDRRGLDPERCELRAVEFGPVWTKTRSGFSRAMISASGFRNVPTFGSFATAAGNRQKVETPTTRSPSPSANSVSVMLGEVDTMRAGADDCPWRPAPQATSASATRSCSRRAHLRAPADDAHHAREKRLPVLPVASRSEPLTPASCSSLRPNSHKQIGQAIHVGQNRRLDDRAGFLQPHERALGAAADRARHVVGRRGAMLARNRPVAEHALDRFDPMHFGGEPIDERPDRSTICGFGLSAGVASDEPILNRSCWMPFVNAAISASSQIDRAKPSDEFSSSIVP